MQLTTQDQELRLTYATPDAVVNVSRHSRFDVHEADNLGQWQNQPVGSLADMTNFLEHNLSKTLVESVSPDIHVEYEYSLSTNVPVRVKGCSVIWLLKE